MQEPFETPPPEASLEGGAPTETSANGSGGNGSGGNGSGANGSAAKTPSGWPEEIIATPETAMAEPSRSLAESGRSGEGQAPLHEIATAFRMNAEALHTLKQMQAELSDSVRRGDRSQLVLQSTRALNDTFRNLTAVQRELLSRLDGSRPAPATGRGALIPMLILGLLVVLLGGIYIVLDAIESQGGRTTAQGPQQSPTDHAQRVMDSWTKGRSEGAAHADAEIRRLTEQIDEEKGRGRRLEQDLGTRDTEVASLERAKRAAELERDGFAGQVRQAQASVVANRALEEEVLRLTGQTGGTKRILQQVEQDLDVERRTNAFLRRRLADYGMGYSQNDPPWRPGVPAGAEDPKAPGKITKLPPSLDEKHQRLDLLIAGRKKLGMSTKDLERERAALDGGASGGTSDGPPPAPASVGWGRSAVPPPAAVAGDDSAGQAAPAAPATTEPTATSTAAGPPPTLPAGTRPEAGSQAAPRAAAYGGDGPGTLPPPAVLRRRGPPAREPAPVASVQAQLNGLLAGGGGREGWRVTRIAAVAPDSLADVTLMRFDAAGRPVERVEAGDMRVPFDRERRFVEFDVRDGLRVAGSTSTPLPAAGRRIVVAQGAAAEKWSASSLPLIRKP